MACGLSCPSPLHLGAAGSYSSVKSLNTSSCSSPGFSSSPAAVEIVCKKREWGERESFAPYFVTVVTPPPRNLGIHSLPP